MDSASARAEGLASGAGGAATGKGVPGRHACAGEPSMAVGLKADRRRLSNVILNVFRIHEGLIVRTLLLMCVGRRRVG